MRIEKLLLGLWAVLSLVSLAIDSACVWIDAHGSVQPLLDAWGVNYITLFLWSAPVPFVLAILLSILGAVYGVAGWIAQLGDRHRCTVLIEQTPHDQSGAAARRDAA